MTIKEAIKRADILMPNQYSKEQKIIWLSELEGQAKREVFDLYKDSPAENFTQYTEETDENTTLLIPPPYDGVYTDWLQAQFSYFNAEFTRHGNAQLRFNNSYLTFQAYWIRTHERAQESYMRF